MLYDYTSGGGAVGRKLNYEGDRMQELRAEDVITNYPKTRTYKVVVFKRPLLGHEEGHLGLITEGDSLICGEYCTTYCPEKDGLRKDLEVIDEFTEGGWTPRVGDIVMDTLSENTDGETYGAIGEIVMPDYLMPGYYKVQFGENWWCRCRNKDELVYLDHIDEEPAPYIFKHGDKVLSPSGQVVTYDGLMLDGKRACVTFPGGIKDCSIPVKDLLPARDEPKTTTEHIEEGYNYSLETNCYGHVYVVKKCQHCGHETRWPAGMRRDGLRA